MKNLIRIAAVAVTAAIMPARANVELAPGAARVAEVAPPAIPTMADFLKGSEIEKVQKGGTGSFLFLRKKKNGPAGWSMIASYFHMYGVAKDETIPYNDRSILFFVPSGSNTAYYQSVDKLNIPISSRSNGYPDHQYRILLTLPDMTTTECPVVTGAGSDFFRNNDDETARLQNLLETGALELSRNYPEEVAIILDGYKDKNGTVYLRSITPASSNNYIHILSPDLRQNEVSLIHAGVSGGGRADEISFIGSLMTIEKKGAPADYSFTYNDGRKIALSPIGNDDVPTNKLFLSTPEGMRLALDNGENTKNPGQVRLTTPCRTRLGDPTP